jgi:hypothetical protein
LSAGVSQREGGLKFQNDSSRSALRNPSLPRYGFRRIVSVRLTDG